MGGAGGSTGEHGSSGALEWWQVPGVVEWQAVLPALAWDHPSASLAGCWELEGVVTLVMGPIES